MVADTLAAIAFVCGAGLIVLVVWNLFHGGEAQSSGAAARWRWQRVAVLGSAFGVAWTAEAVVGLRSGATLELSMQVVSGAVLAAFFLFVLLAHSRAGALLPLLLRAAYRMTPEEEATADVEDLLRSGKRLLAVRAYRTQTGASLHQAAAVVRAMERKAASPRDGRQ